MKFNDQSQQKNGVVSGATDKGLGGKPLPSGTHREEFHIARGATPTEIRTGSVLSPSEVIARIKSGGDVSGVLYLKIDRSVGKIGKVHDPELTAAVIRTQ